MKTTNDGSVRFIYTYTLTIISKRSYAHNVHWRMEGISISAVHSASENKKNNFSTEVTFLEDKTEPKITEINKCVNKGRKTSKQSVWWNCFGCVTRPRRAAGTTEGLGGFTFRLHTWLKFLRSCNFQMLRRKRPIWRDGAQGLSSASRRLWSDHRNTFQVFTSASRNTVSRRGRPVNQQGLPSGSYWPSLDFLQELTTSNGSGGLYLSWSAAAPALKGYSGHFREDVLFSSDQMLSAVTSEDGEGSLGPG